TATASARLSLCRSFRVNLSDPILGGTTAVVPAVPAPAAPTPAVPVVAPPVPPAVPEEPAVSPVPAAPLPADELLPEAPLVVPVPARPETAGAPEPVSPAEPEPDVLSEGAPLEAQAAIRNSSDNFTTVAERTMAILPVELPDGVRYPRPAGTIYKGRAR